MSKLPKIIGDYDAFLRAITAEITAEGFDMTDFVQMDHRCYRTSSLENYTEKKTQIAEVAELLGETQVNGRPIATFRLHTPILFEQWRIDTLELPAPKPSKATSEGLEHVEFVLYDSIDAFLDKYKGKEFKLGAADRGINPEVGYNLPSYGVKFHLLNLPTVVYLESKLGLTEVQS